MRICLYQRSISIYDSTTVVAAIECLRNTTDFVNLMQYWDVHVYSFGMAFMPDLTAGIEPIPVINWR